MVIVDADCNGDRVASGQDFDLGHIRVERDLGRYHFDAVYSGPAAGHNILVTFDLGETMYKVDAELFEDGKGVGRVLDARSNDSLFLDPPQVIAVDRVNLIVGSDQIERISGAPFAVSATLKVDGTEVETCS